MGRSKTPRSVEYPHYNDYGTFSVANKMKVCQILWTHVSPTPGKPRLRSFSGVPDAQCINTPTTRRIEVTARSVEVDSADPSPYRVQPGLYSRQINRGAAVSANAWNPWYPRLPT